MQRAILFGLFIVSSIAWADSWDEWQARENQSYYEEKTGENCAARTLSMDQDTRSNVESFLCETNTPDTVLAGKVKLEDISNKVSEFYQNPDAQEKAFLDYVSKRQAQEYTCLNNYLLSLTQMQRRTDFTSRLIKANKCVDTVMSKQNNKHKPFSATPPLFDKKSSESLINLTDSIATMIQGIRNAESDISEIEKEIGTLDTSESQKAFDRLNKSNDEILELDSIRNNKINTLKEALKKLQVEREAYYASIWNIETIEMQTYVSKYLDPKKQFDRDTFKKEAYKQGGLQKDVISPLINNSISAMEQICEVKGQYKDGSGLDYKKGLVKSKVIFKYLPRPEFKQENDYTKLFGKVACNLNAKYGIGAQLKQSKDLLVLGGVGIAATVAVPVLAYAGHGGRFAQLIAAGTIAADVGMSTKDLINTFKDTCKKFEPEFYTSNACVDPNKITQYGIEHSGCLLARTLGALGWVGAVAGLNDLKGMMRTHSIASKVAAKTGRRTQEVQNLIHRMIDVRNAGKALDAIGDSKVAIKNMDGLLSFLDKMFVDNPSLIMGNFPKSLKNNFFDMLTQSKLNEREIATLLNSNDLEKTIGNILYMVHREGEGLDQKTLASIGSGYIKELARTGDSENLDKSLLQLQNILYATKGLDVNPKHLAGLGRKLTESTDLKTGYFDAIAKLSKGTENPEVNKLRRALAREMTASISNLEEGRAFNFDTISEAMTSAEKGNIDDLKTIENALHSFNNIEGTNGFVAKITQRINNLIKDPKERQDMLNRILTCLVSRKTAWNESIPYDQLFACNQK